MGCAVHAKRNPASRKKNHRQIGKIQTIQVEKEADATQICWLKIRCRFFLVKS
jgi:hypothetical protein